jgi:hypothetical protein
MTRINVVPPSELCDKHLLAEYRELPRVFKLARPDADIPAVYVLGTGHVTFFYNKLAFLAKRAEAIYACCRARGFKVQFKPAGLWKACPHKELYQDWTPTKAAIKLNRARIAERMKAFKR